MGGPKSPPVSILALSPGVRDSLCVFLSPQNTADKFLLILPPLPRSNGQCDPWSTLAVKIPHHRGRVEHHVDLNGAQHDLGVPRTIHEATGRGAYDNIGMLATVPYLSSTAGADYMAAGGIIALYHQKVAGLMGVLKHIHDGVPHESAGRTFEVVRIITNS